MTTAMRIFIQDTEITDDIENFSIDFPGNGAYCNLFAATAKGLESWYLCDPDVDRLQTRVKIIINSDVYLFFLEERSEVLGYADFTFKISGRSASAALGEGFATLITDTNISEKSCSHGCVEKCYNQADCEAIGGTWDGTNEICTDPGGVIPCEGFHVWQNVKTKPSEIIDFLQQSDYVPVFVDIEWLVFDFTIFAGTYSAEQKYPAQIISELAGVIGAELYARPDGSLSVESYAVSGSPVADFNDETEIVAQDCETIRSPGIDNVLILGAITPAADEEEAAVKQPYIGIIPPEKTQFAPNEEIKLKIPYWHPTSNIIENFQSDPGKITVGVITGFIDSTTEPVRLSWGRGNTQFPDTDGNTEVFDHIHANQYLAIIQHSYTHKFANATISASQTGEYLVAFYFPDKSGAVEFAFTVVDPDQAYGDSTFLKTEEMTESPYEINELANVRLYFFHPDSGTTPDYSAIDPEVTVSAGSPGTVETTETVTLTWGRGNTSMPDTDGNTEVFFPAHENEPLAYEDVTYVTNCIDYEISANAEGVFPISFYFPDKSGAVTWEIEVVITPTHRDITIVSENYYSGVAVDGDQVWIDGVYVGTTDANGTLDVPNVSIGDHTIKFVKTGYKNSDEDSLENDTFTVT